MAVFYKALGRNVRAARKANALTQEQMADRLGISRLHYGKLERGERQVSLEQIAQLADALGVSAYALLEGCFSGACPSDVSRCEEIAQRAACCSQKGQRLIADICALIAQEYDL